MVYFQSQSAIMDARRGIAKSVAVSFFLLLFSLISLYKFLPQGRMDSSGMIRVDYHTTISTTYLSTLLHLENTAIILLL